MRSFKSNENTHKKEDGSYYVVSANKAFESLNVDDKPVSEITGENPNKLSYLDSLKLEGEITYNELTNALNIMKNAKSPGNDGFRVEFFKFSGSISDILFLSL